MAALRDQHPAALLAVMHPVPGRDLPGVDAVVQDGRRRPVRKELLHPPGKRGVAPIEPDHQPLPGLVPCGNDLLKFLDAGGKRLLHEDIFSGTESLGRKASMQVVAGRDQHRIDRRIA